MSAVFNYLVKFAGRARRSEYATYLLTILFSSMALSGSYTSLYFDVHPWSAHLKTLLDMAIFAIAIVAFIGTMIGYFSITVRRLHDYGVSGWFALLLFVPPAGALLLLMLNILTPGQSGSNRYGTDPQTDDVHLTLKHLDQIYPHYMRRAKIRKAHFPVRR